MKNCISVLIFSILSILSFSQSAPINIDGKFDDWNSSFASYVDAPETIFGIDLLEFQVSNDEDFLYIHFVIDTEISLIDNIIDHGVRLYMDTDNDPNTGFTGAQNGFGSEIGIIFRDRFAYYNVTPFSTVNFSDFDFRRETTVTGLEYEIAIGRNAIPDGVNPLFTSNTIKILFIESFDDDEMPNLGDSFSYTFDDTPIDSYVPVLLEKANDDLIRICAYNTLNHLDDLSYQDEFERIFQATDPDVIGFSEANGIEALDVKTLLDDWLPLGNVNGWYTIKDDYDLITASKWPFMDDWSNLDRQHPVLIDLPGIYESDLLFVNAHLKCCGDGDVQRQAQVDEFASFILDAKSLGGQITLPENTPFIYCGDMNLVGLKQQYETILTGDIQDTGTYGTGGFLDWDNTEISDACPSHSDQRIAYTWRDDFSEFPPGRLDFIFYSDAVVSVPKTFVLNTGEMSVERLSSYGLQSADCETVSDHLPLFVDAQVMILADSDEDGISDESDNCPDEYNPDQLDWNANNLGDVCEDSDEDGLTDAEELLIHLTNPSLSDSDLDGVNDLIEISDLNTDPNIQDTDGDGLTDGLEAAYGITNPLMFDTDLDGCNDASFFHFECDGQSSEPCSVDTNGDNVINVIDLVIISSNFGSTCD